MGYLKRCIFPSIRNYVYLMHSNPNSPGSAHPVDHVNQMPGARTPAQTLGAPLLSQRTWTRGCERTSHRHAALPAGLPLCFTATKPRYYYILISGSRHVRTTRSYSSPLNSAQTLLKLFWTVARSAFLWALTPATKPEGRAAAPCPSSTQGWRLESQRRFAEGLTAVLTQRPPHPHLIRALLAAEPHPFWVLRAEVLHVLRSSYHALHLPIPHTFDAEVLACQKRWALSSPSWQEGTRSQTRRLLQHPALFPAHQTAVLLRSHQSNHTGLTASPRTKSHQSLHHPTC